MKTAFHHLAYLPLEICNALSWDSLKSCVEGAGLKPEARVLDIGCGYGQASILMAQTFDVAVTAVEQDPVMAAGARERIAQARLTDRIVLRNETSLETLKALPKFDLILALGTTYPAGRLKEPREIFAALKQYLNPQACLIWGDLTWTSEPPEPLRMLVESGGYYVGHEDWQGAAKEAGFSIEAARLSEPAEWPPYLEGMQGAINDWIDAHPDHPDAASVATSAHRVQMMFEFGADYLNFGLYRFRNPD